MRCDFSKGQIQCAQEHNQTIDNHWTAIKRNTCMQLNDVYTFPQIHCTITKTKNSNHFMNEMYRKKIVSSNKPATQWMCVCIQQLAFHFYHEFPPIARSSVNIAFEHFTHSERLALSGSSVSTLLNFECETNFWTSIRFTLSTSNYNIVRDLFGLQIWIFN